MTLNPIYLDGDLRAYTYEVMEGLDLDKLRSILEIVGRMKDEDEK